MRCAIFLFIVVVAGSDDYPRTSLENGIDKASVKMLKESYLKSQDSNVVTSPLGVLLLLALYSSGTEGVSRDEIMTLLGSSDYKELTKSYTGLGEKLASVNSNFTLANKIFIAEGLTIDDEFSDAARSYKSEVETINFSDLKAAVETINNWAADKTKGLIKNPVSESTLDANAIVALFNVIFFRGHWNVLFKPEDTRDMDFYVNKSVVVKKPMMFLTNSFLYYDAEEIGARLLELPYRESSFRMVVFLPYDVDGLDSMLDKVTEKGLLEHISAMQTSHRAIDLYMPKFEIRSKLDYKSILAELGVQEIFKSPGASKIVKDYSAPVSQFIQEATVKVDEEGSTAGAFTAIHAAVSVPLDFIVDHPFLFVILRENVVLFTGTYSQ